MWLSFENSWNSNDKVVVMLLRLDRMVLHFRTTRMIGNKYVKLSLSFFLVGGREGRFGNSLLRHRKCRRRGCQRDRIDKLSKRMRIVARFPSPLLVEEEEETGDEIEQGHSCSSFSEIETVVFFLHE